MKRILFLSIRIAIVALVLSITGVQSVYGQYYMNVFQKNGTKKQYVVADIDSINVVNTLDVPLDSEHPAGVYYIDLYRGDKTRSQIYTNDIENISFTSEPDVASCLEFVDLGLSVNWATFNVGATSHREYGDYFAWGEVEPHYEAGYAQEKPQAHWKEGKSNYSWSTYKHCNGTSGNLTKYNLSSENGIVDNKIVLEPEDDAAHVCWGGDWRMPTYDEFAELLNNCSWTWTEQYGINGYIVTSKKTGYTDRSIFLPAAGSFSYDGTKDDYVFDGLNDIGRYWASSVNDGCLQSAWGFSFGLTSHDVSQAFRCYGYTVRPVCPSETWEGYTSIAIDTINTAMAVGESYKFKVTPMNGNLEYDFLYSKIENQISWSLSNESVATVNADNEITALSLGVTKLYAHYNGLTDSCIITVVDPYSNIGSEQSYGYVDLGLSVKWATCNIDAVTPEDFGGYYAWGETETKSTYDWSTYKYCNGSSRTFTKYCNKSGYGNDGFTDGKTKLEPEDDVAHVKWGGSWRMPTEEEFIELLNNCTWIWTRQNGAYGYKVISNKSGYTDRSIFLPAAGYLGKEDSYDRLFDGGYYWSSSLHSSYPHRAEYLYFYHYFILVKYKEYFDKHETGGSIRDNGRSVRPVCPSETWGITSIKIDASYTTMMTGEEYKLKVQFKSGDLDYDFWSDNFKIKWSSSNESVATVDSTGVIKALSVGSTTITASLNTLKAECKINVSLYTPLTGLDQGYVDLGLSVKWATCNVGATKPEEYGDYYAWGETEPKSFYRMSTYKYCNSDDNKITKYCDADKKTVLDASDDVAHVKWGGSWRMPTSDEFQELLNSCTWTWTTKNDVNGYLVTSNKSGFTDRSIFLPAAGYRTFESLGRPGSEGSYWSSSLNGSYYAWMLGFVSGGFSMGNSQRDYGMTVRPVCP